MAEKRTTDYKVVLMGASFVGKSSLGTCYMEENYTNFQHPTVGAAFLQKVIPVDPTHDITMGIWDTAGQERFKSMLPLYYRGAAAAIVVYDVTDISSFEDMVESIKDVLARDPTIKFFVVGNKIDLPASEHVVPEEEAQELAASLDTKLYFTSALTGEGVHELFNSIIEYLKEDALNSDNKREQDDPTLANKVDLNSKPQAHQEKRSKCC